MTFEFDEDELYTLKMAVKTELDELPGLLEVLDSKDKAEMLEYKEKVQKIYDKLNK